MQNISIDSPFDQLRKAAPSWNLEGDIKLLEVMKKIAEGLENRLSTTKCNLDKMFLNLDRTEVSLGNATNGLFALQHNQFVENRVYDEDETVVKVKEFPAQDELENKKYDPIETIKIVLKNSFSAFEECYEKISLDYDDSDDEENLLKTIIYRKKELHPVRRIPHLIGSEEWKRQWHVGLLDESDEQSGDEDQEVTTSPEGSVSSSFQSNVLLERENPAWEFYGKSQKDKIFPSSDDESMLAYQPSNTSNIREFTVPSNYCNPSVSKRNIDIPKEKTLFVNSSEESDTEVNKKDTINNGNQILNISRANLYKTIKNEPTDLDEVDRDARSEPELFKNDKSKDIESVENKLVQNVDKFAASKKTVNLFDDDNADSISFLADLDNNDLFNKSLTKTINLFDNNENLFSQDEIQKTFFKENDGDKVKSNTSKQSKENESLITDQINSDYSNIFTKTQFINPKEEISYTKGSKTIIANLFDDQPPDDDFDTIFKSTTLNKNFTKSGFKNTNKNKEQILSDKEEISTQKSNLNFDTNLTDEDFPSNLGSVSPSHKKLTNKNELFFESKHEDKEQILPDKIEVLTEKTNLTFDMKSVQETLPNNTDIESVDTLYENLTNKNHLFHENKKETLSDKTELIFTEIISNNKNSTSSLSLDTNSVEELFKDSSRAESVDIFNENISIKNEFLSDSPRGVLENEISSHINIPKPIIENSNISLENSLLENQTEEIFLQNERPEQIKKNIVEDLFSKEPYLKSLDTNTSNQNVENLTLAPPIDTNISTEKLHKSDFLDSIPKNKILFPTNNLRAENLIPKTTISAEIETCNENLVAKTNNSLDYANLGFIHDIPPDDDFDTLSDTSSKHKNNIFYDDFSDLYPSEPQYSSKCISEFLFHDEPPPDDFIIHHQINLPKKEIDNTQKLEINESISSTKKVNKIAGNLNINVTTLLPNSKMPEIKRETNSNNSYESKSSESIKTETVQTKSLPNVEVLNKESSMLSSLNKTRAKISIKRKPSTRRARKENYERTLTSNEEIDKQKNTSETVSTDMASVSDTRQTEESKSKVLIQKKSNENNTKNLRKSKSIFDDDSDEDLFQNIVTNKLPSANKSKSKMLQTTKNALFSSEEEDEIFSEKTKSKALVKKGKNPSNPVNLFSDIEDEHDDLFGLETSKNFQQNTKTVSYKKREEKNSLVTEKNVEDNPLADLLN